MRRSQTAGVGRRAVRAGAGRGAKERGFDENGALRNGPDFPKNVDGLCTLPGTDPPAGPLSPGVPAERGKNNGSGKIAPWFGDIAFGPTRGALRVGTLRKPSYPTLTHGETSMRTTRCHPARPLRSGEPPPWSVPPGDLARRSVDEFYTRRPLGRQRTPPAIDPYVILGS